VGHRGGGGFSVGFFFWGGAGAFFCFGLWFCPPAAQAFYGGSVFVRGKRPGKNTRLYPGGRGGKRRRGRVGREWELGIAGGKTRWWGPRGGTHPFRGQKKTEKTKKTRGGPGGRFGDFFFCQGGGRQNKKPSFSPGFGKKQKKKGVFGHKKKKKKRVFFGGGFLGRGRRISGGGAGGGGGGPGPGFGGGIPAFYFRGPRARRVWRKIMFFFSFFFWGKILQNRGAFLWAKGARGPRPAPPGDFLTPGGVVGGGGGGRGGGRGPTQFSFFRADLLTPKARGPFRFARGPHRGGTGGRGFPGGGPGAGPREGFPGAKKRGGGRGGGGGQTNGF